MSKQTIGAFNGEGFRLGLSMLLWWNELLLRLPIVRHDLVNQRTMDAIS